MQINTDHLTNRIVWVKSMGYTQEVDITGTFGASELAMYMNIVDCIGHKAYVRPDRQNYAFVLYTDRDGKASITEGSFNLFDDGSFSLA
jgi:hypothetical protein